MIDKPDPPVLKLGPGGDFVKPWPPTGRLEASALVHLAAAYARGMVDKKRLAQLHRRDRRAAVHLAGYVAALDAAALAAVEKVAPLYARDHYAAMAAALADLVADAITLAVARRAKAEAQGGGK